MADSVGIDIVDKSRIEQIWKRHSDRFIKRLLSGREIELFQSRGDKISYLAGRFAAKEAVVKALGEYLDRRPPLSTIEILPDKTGRPILHLQAGLIKQESSLRWLISISHEKTHAVAVAICTEVS